MALPLTKPTTNLNHHLNQNFTETDMLAYSYSGDLSVKMTLAWATT
jgi:hypothetical protein